MRGHAAWGHCLACFTPAGMGPQLAQWDRPVDGGAAALAAGRGGGVPAARGRLPLLAPHALHGPLMLPQAAVGLVTLCQQQEGARQEPCMSWGQRSAAWGAAQLAYVLHGPVRRWHPRIHLQSASWPSQLA